MRCWYDPGASCFAGLGIAFEVRTGATPAGEWVVFEGLTARGRVPHGHAFVQKARHFDYPLDYTLEPFNGVPPPQIDVQIAFAPIGPLPTLDGQTFVFTTSQGTQPTTARDVLSNQGFASDVYAYTSPRYENLVFTALTGTNAVLRLSPANVGASQGALIVYR